MEMRGKEARGGKGKGGKGKGGKGKGGKGKGGGMFYRRKSIVSTITHNLYFIRTFQKNDI